MKKIITLFIFLLTTNELLADIYKWREGHQLTFGSEIFHQERRAHGPDGVTKMDGWFHGWRGSYDHIIQNTLYWGIEAVFDQGDLSGTHASGPHQRADFVEWEGELRLGFTFGKEKGEWRNILFSPFAGYQYWRGNTRFDLQELVLTTKPTLLPFPDNEEHFHAWLIGFFLSFDVCERARLGLDARAICMINRANISICDDATTTLPHIERKMGERFHWVLQAPIDIIICKDHENIRLRLMPFYHYRLFGFRLASPKNFQKTRYQSYGLSAMLWYEV